MKLTVLVDNNTYIDQYYHGEPAASFYIETEGAAVLFDTGYSDIFISNAQKMGIDLSAVTHIVLSHGHDDHTRGLKFLKDTMDLSEKKLIAHPECFLPKYNGDLYIGSPFSEKEISEFTSYVPCKGVYEVTDNLIFLGEIPRANSYENQKAVGTFVQDGELKDDYLMDDTAMVYKGEKGLFIITGCSHSGICNIIEFAKSVCKDERVYGVLGGFHLFEDDEQLRKTITYLESNHIEKFYPCHCVSLLAKTKMMSSLPVVECGVGLVVEVE